LLVCWNGLCILAPLYWFVQLLRLVPSGLTEANAMDRLSRLHLYVIICYFVGPLSVWVRFSP
jgi:hypothetical protein